MEIKDIQGNILIEVPITESAVKTDELMKQHSISLSWSAIANEELPLGSYIEYDGIRYSLLAPYKPQQKDEVEYEYKPVFEHPVMRWQYLPFLFYTYSGDKLVSKEPDWSLTDNAANFMSSVCDAIKQQTGESWTYEIADNLPASASLSFNNTDIFSALGSIASQFETEWWFDYAEKVIYLSKASYGNAVTLEVGQNIGIPSVNQSKNGYYTRFLVFGSTRNIEQNYQGSNTNSIVNRRLTLNPAKYPDGYIDIRQGLSNDEILSKTIVFDDIYPRSMLTISNVKVRLMWRLDSDNKKVQIGTDADGKPVYDQYAIWYFKIPALSFNKDMVISGKVLSVHFNDGPLQGREFELTYHDVAKDVETSDGTSIRVDAGDFEINFIEEGTYIIPAMTGLVPVDGNSVSLFNIVMPEEYKASAYEELEEAALKEIAKQGEDMSNYSFSSNAVEFFMSNPALKVGRKVTYKNGDYSYSTRVIKLETQLDRPYEQKITIGNEQIKGNTQTLKEEVVSANQNIDLISAINESTQQLMQSYQRTQKALLDSMSKWGNMWRLDAENNAVYTPLNLIVEGTIGMCSLGEGGSGEVATPNITIKFYGSGIPYTPDANGVITLPAYPEGGEGGITQVTAQMIEEALGYVPYSSKNPSEYITSAALAGYAKSADVANTYATKVALQTLQDEHNALSTKVTNLDNLLNSDVSGVINTWGEVVDFLDEYSGSEDLATILAGMNNDITAVSNRVKTFEDVIGIDANGDVYIKGTRNFYTEGGTIGMAGLGSGGSGGGTAGLGSVTVRVNGQDYITDASGIVTLPNYPSLAGYATESWVSANYQPKGNYLTSVSWSDVSSKPTTLAGYGITDAVKAGVVNQADTIIDWSDANQSFAGSIYTDGSWKNLISVRHRNGASDGNLYGMVVYTNMTGSGNLIWRKRYSSGWEPEKTILDSNNYSSYALPLSGGKTITGNFTLANGVNILNASGYGIFVYDDTNTATCVGTVGAKTKIRSNDSALIHERQGTDYAILDQSNALSLLTNGNTIYHSGNANKADVSWTASNILFPQGTSATWNVYTAGAYKGITILNTAGAASEGAPNDYAVGLSVSGYYGFTLAHYGGGALYWLKGSGDADWYALIHSGNIGSQSVSYASGAGNAEKVGGVSVTSGNNKPWGTIPAITPGGYMDVGKHFEFHYDNTTGSDYSTVLMCTGNYGNIVNLPSTSGTLALLTDNVASATKLQTSRTIWGQSFNGSGNVDGTAIFTFNDGQKIIIEQKAGGSNYCGISFFNSGFKVGSITASTLLLNPVYGGNVLIGTSSDSGGKLQISGNIKFLGGVDREIGTAYSTTDVNTYNRIIIGSNNTGIKYCSGRWTSGNVASHSFCVGTNDTTAMAIMNNGNVLIGTTSDNGYKLQVAGGATFVGDVYSEGTIAMAKLASSSDAKLKENIKWLSADRAMGVVRALRPTEWDWKKDHTHSFGFIAQDVQPIIPEMVSSVNDTLRLEYNQLHAFEIGAIQHIDSEVEQLKRDLKTANNRIEVLESKLKQYELWQ